MNWKQLAGIVAVLLLGGLAAYYGLESDEAAPPAGTATAPAEQTPTAAAPPPPAPPKPAAVAEKPRGPVNADNLIGDAKSATEEKSDPAAEAAAAAKAAAENAATAAEKGAEAVADAAKDAAAEAERMADQAAKDAGKALREAGDAAEKTLEQAGKEGGKALDQAGKAIGKSVDAAAKAAGDAAKDAEKAASEALDKARKLLNSGDGQDKPAKPPGEKDVSAPKEQMEAKADAAALERAAKEQAAKEQAAKEQAAREKAAREEAAKKQLAALPDPKASAEEKPAAKPPVFDVAEVDANGDMTVAGVAAPGARVRLLRDDGKVLGEAIAGEDGAFVILPSERLPAGDSTLRLETDDGAAGVNGARGPETIVVSRQPGAAPLVVLQQDDGAAPSRILQEPAPQRATPDTTATAKADPKPDAATGDASDQTPVRTRDESLAVRAVDYDDKGGVAVQGEAKPGADVSVEIDGKKVADAKADKDGKWRASAGPGAVRGGKTDRIVASAPAGAEGRVLKVSLPFAPAGLIKDFPAGRIVVVQPGNSLWRIARRTYGQGVRYTVIYAANRDQIDDPDMIFPGQILHTPKGG